MAVKKTKSKSSTKAPKRIEVVFEDSKKVIKKEKPVFNKKSKKQKVSFEKSPIKTVSKEQKHPEEHKHHETHKHVTKETKNKTKDYIIIAILALLIIGIVVIAFLVPVDFNKDDNVVDINAPIIDKNQNLDLNIENFEKRSLAVTMNILKDMREYQKNILEEHYESLSINKEEMDACLLENNFLLEDTNLFDYPKVKLIQDDFREAQERFVFSTPTMYVNGYYLTGFKDYNTFTNFIDKVKDSESLTLDYTDKSFSYTEDALKVYYVYDKESEVIKESNLAFIDYLKTSELLISNVNSVFTTIFDINNIEYVQYNTEKGKDILQTIDAESLPAIYVLGDVSSLDFNGEDNKAIFNIIFEKENINNGYRFKKEVLPQLIIGSSFDGVYRVLDYKNLVKEDDKVLGFVDADTTIILFTDYDCPFCRQLETDTLTDIFSQNYIDAGKVGLVIKPLVTNDIFSIFPILFLKCSENQDASLSVHKKLFELNPVIGVQTVYDLVKLKYADEMAALEVEYSLIISSMEGN